MTAAEVFRYLILAAQREGNRLLGDLLKPHGLTPSQAEVLRVLADERRLSLQELGQRLVCETGSPSRLVDGLVKAGYVDRVTTATDRRRVELTLTPSGKRAARRVATVEHELHELIAASIPPDTLEIVNTTLWQLVADRPAGQALALRTTPPPPSNPKDNP
jgi:MarR family transcriptional regulator, organic hydroperoxide resistance regulator